MYLLFPGSVLEKFHWQQTRKLVEHFWLFEADFFENIFIEHCDETGDAH